jgi:DNA-binding transcriptional LysR family regulator
MPQVLKVEWDKLKMFYQIASYATFSDAAKALNKNQSSISRTIQILESQLKCKLLIRSPKGLQLTPAGKVVLEAVKHTMLIIQSAMIEAKQHHD